MQTDETAWTSRVDQQIARVIDDVAQAAAPAGQEAGDIVEALRRASQGGKRLRARLVLTSHDAHGGTREDAAITLAAALELFQTAALIHDDVLDDSDTRRGAPSAHRAIAQLHHERGGLGSPQEFGAAGGILAGDLALMACRRALDDATAALDGADRTATTRLFSRMAELVTAGQYLDMSIAARPLAEIAQQEAQIRATMRCKSASYSTEFPLGLGAALAGADDAAQQAVMAVGLPLGLAFQLRDDVLGLVGTPQVTGKPAGDDIREGKRTVIVWNAWNAATAAQRDVLSRVLGQRHASDTDVDAVIAVLVETGALEAAEAEIASLAESAHAGLRALGLEPAAAADLAKLFDLVTRRAA